MHSGTSEWTWDDVEPLEGKYANCFNVGFNFLEVLIDFGQCHSSGPNLLHTRIILQPVFCVELAATLSKCLAEYEQRYGAIGQVSQ